VPAARGSSQVAEYNEDFEQYAGEGMENVGARDVLIPRLAVLQALSPQTKKQRAEYIEGAKEGLICDVGTRDLIGEKLHFLPAMYNKVWVEWAPRDTGRGIVRIHADDSILASCGVNDRNQPVTKEGNLIAETAQFFGFNLDRDMRRSFLPMSSTQLKIARQWMTMATGEKLKRADGSLYPAPIFYRSWELTTVPTTDGDNDWYLWKVEPGPSMPELFPNKETMRSVMNECRLFRQQLEQGEKRGDLSGIDTQEEVRPSSGGRRRGPVTDAEEM
jgi:hypothetical protein